MSQQIFTREEVRILFRNIIEIIESDNRNTTDYNADSLFEEAINYCDKEQLEKGQSIFNDIALISSIEAKSKEGKFCKNIAKKSIAKSISFLYLSK